MRMQYIVIKIPPAPNKSRLRLLYYAGGTFYTRSPGGKRRGKRRKEEENERKKEKRKEKREKTRAAITLNSVLIPAKIVVDKL